MLMCRHVLHCFQRRWRPGYAARAFHAALLGHPICLVVVAFTYMWSHIRHVCPTLRISMT